MYNKMFFFRQNVPNAMTNRMLSAQPAFVPFVLIKPVQKEEIYVLVVPTCFISRATEAVNRFRPLMNGEFPHLLSKRQVPLKMKNWSSF